ncbi:MAG: hypothetical protein ACF8R9_03320 [Phycisphaerales bacterium JB054]
MARLTGPTIVDDSGEARGVVRRSSLRSDDRMADPVFAEIVANADAAGEALGMPTAELVLGFVGVIGANVMHLVMLGAMGPRTPSALVFVVWVAATAVLVLVARRRRLRRAARDVADILLHNGLCAACAYSLRGHYGEGGVVVCPECGAAWREERVVRRHAFGGLGRGREE